MLLRSAIQVNRSGAPWKTLTASQKQAGDENVSSLYSFQEKKIGIIQTKTRKGNSDSSVGREARHCVWEDAPAAPKNQGSLSTVTCACLKSPLPREVRSGPSLLKPLLPAGGFGGGICPVSTSPQASPASSDAWL